ncbi:unnamed protein product [Rotaria socialis]|uniref:Uncharacterized protein n=1 Tax=Rotaria socialis TaxID=392032 RepID=A0A818M1B3_9BILA|nr:unnamed protein product [Rotaria socialis]CAF3580684.1 unnamed protein product [Rotaria socialis]CAF3805770.1 unnamed protein product [Rotaria socialis]CAF4206196.1 unnamed protein product [Rotaria socialis]CAF4353866.1 unnamed protein product [Rotaria socialis]
MTQRLSRDVEYVVVTDRKPKPTQRYYIDSDDDNDSQPVVTTRRIVRTKPIKEHRIKYAEMQNGESDHRQQHVIESDDHGIKIRNTTSGEQIVLDEDDNILKIIRHPRTPTPTPPLLEKRRHKYRHREPRTVFYETSDGQLIARPPKRHESRRRKSEYVYVDNDSPKVVRKVIIDPRTHEQEIIYEKEKPKKSSVQKVKIRKPVNEIIVDPDDDYEQEPEYVKIVRRPVQRTVIENKQPSTKYVMIRKKVEPESSFTLATPPISTNRRVVYASPPKKSPTKYVYSIDGKYYK